MSRKRNFDEDAPSNKRGRVIKITDADVDPIYTHPRTINKFAYIISMLLEKGNSYILFLQEILDEPMYDFYISNRYTDDPTLLQDVFTRDVKEQIRVRVTQDLLEFREHLESLNPWEKKYLLMLNPSLISEISEVLQKTEGGPIYPYPQRTYHDLGASLNFTLLEIMQDRNPEIFLESETISDHQQLIEAINSSSKNDAKIPKPVTSLTPRSTSTLPGVGEIVGINHPTSQNPFLQTSLTPSPPPPQALPPPPPPPPPSPFNNRSQFQLPSSQFQLPPSQFNPSQKKKKEGGTFFA